MCRETPVEIGKDEAVTKNRLSCLFHEQQLNAPSSVHIDALDPPAAAIAVAEVMAHSH